MKILHVGDIHLGCRLENNSRNEEIGKVFDFILTLVKERQIEATLLAGDVFDNGHPSVESQDMYYNFLLDLQKAGCHQVIVIAGNHDNPDFLDAPKWLLQRMNIHVVGNVDTSRLEQEVIPLGEESNPTAIVCAVPQLEHKDVCGLVPEGTEGDRKQIWSLGVSAHYRKVWEIADKLRAGRDIPIIGMGHLFASGSHFRSNEEQNVVGKLDCVHMEDFAKGYDYMALGHIHKPQRVAEHDNWRYAGSILPMKIQENNPVPQVIVLDTADLSMPEGVEIPDSCIHKMLCIKGDMEELGNKLRELRERNEQVWVKVVYTGEEAKPNWAIDLRMECRDSDVQIVETEVKRNLPEQPTLPPPLRISQMTPLKVFEDHAKNHCQYPENQLEELRKLFLQAHDEVVSPQTAVEAPKAPVAGRMKFKKLTIKNVNSLYGENVIDFEAADFHTGIFLISGPTGAGKSSILDAICLALYHATPRAGDITQNNNPIMSQGQNDMRVELTFSLGQDEYRAEFSQKRTKKGQKPFEQYQHHLYKNGQEIKADDVARDKTGIAIERLIGMNLGQFTQCVLLAQGSFAKFLAAKGDDRAPLLAQITGTKIYNEIGAKISQKYSDIDRAREALLVKMKGISCLSEAERAAIVNDLNEKKKTLAVCDGELQNCDRIELIFKNIERYEASVQEGEQALTQANAAKEAAAPQQALLEAALRAQNCQATYDAFHAQELKQNETNGQRTKLLESKNELEKEWEAATGAAKQAKEKLNALESKQEDTAKLFQEVRGLDLQIRNTEQLADKAKKDRNEAKTTQKNAREKYATVLENWNQQKAAAEESRKYWDAHAADEGLIHKREGWEIRRTDLVEFEEWNATEVKAVAADDKALKSDKKKLEKQNAAKKQTADRLQTILESIQNLEQAKNEALAGKTPTELNNLWAAAGELQDFFEKNSSREEFLTPGQECPLCGSIVHPYCDGSAVPKKHDYSKEVAELKARLDKVGDCDAKLYEANLEREGLLKSFEHLEPACKDLEEKIKTASDALDARRKLLEDKQENASNDAKVLQEELRAALQVEWTDHAKLPAELQIRIDAFERAKAVVDGFLEAQHAFDKATGEFQAVDQRNTEDLTAKEQALAQLTEQLTGLKNRRQELFGDEDVASREKEFNGQLQDARQADNDSTNRVTAATTNVKNNGEALEANQNELARIAEELQTRQNELTTQLLNFGFNSEEEFLRKQMEPAALQQLQKKLAELDTAVTTADATLAQRRKTLAEESNKLPEGTDRQANLAKRTELQNQKSSIQEVCEKLNGQLMVDNDHLKETEEARRELAEMEPLYNNWTELNRVFGNKDGSAFARIAQGYTFRELIYCANQNRLTSLKNHFDLVSDENDPLELDVIDHYRGDQIRTSRNLSGGEQFEVSLALALGLADMSSISQHASLGNVLLDEGFGTLDEEALDSALELLTQLKSTDGKLVGIISHVAKLGEKIPTQIKVSTSGGMGSLEGAGVQRVAIRQKSATEQSTKPKKRKKAVR